MSIPKGYAIAGVRAGWRITTDKVERRLARFSSRFIPQRKDHRMIKISNWQAKRSGAAITLVGKDAAGNDFKAAVSKILKDGAKVIASSSDGTRYELA